MARRLPTTVPATTDGQDLVAAWHLVTHTWMQDATLAAQSMARFTEIGDRFVTRLTASGIGTWRDVDAGACESFITAPTRSGTAPRIATQHTRRAALRATFRVLREQGVVDGDPTLDLVLPARGRGQYRPLTDDEIHLGRAAARLAAGSRTLLRAVAWALAEASAASSEIGTVRVGDLDDPQHPRTVTFPASARFATRTVPLTDWGAQLLRRHLEGPTPPAPQRLLAYAGHGTNGRYLAQASVCAGLGRVLDLAGLRADPAVRPRSVRGWAGRTRYDAGMPLEDVAVVLGYRSLDGAAAEIGLDWATRAASSARATSTSRGGE